MQTFGEALLGLIKASRFGSQRQFALAIGMEPTYMNRIIKGNVKRPDLETLAKMAEALGYDYGKLMDMAGYPSPPGGAGNGSGTPPPPPEDRAFDRSDVIAWVESLKTESPQGQEFARQLDRLRAGRSDEEWWSVAEQIFRVQNTARVAMAEAFERLNGPR